MTEIERDMTIEEFCKTHNACEEGWNWAIANCKTMAECWEKLPSGYLIWTATRAGVLSDKELRLFAVFCCREIWTLLTDERSRNAVEAAEKFANGQATMGEMQVAAHAAAYADDVAADAAAYAAAYADDAARAARVAAHAAAYAATYADDAAAAVAYGAARQKQADWLKANTTPNFKRTAKNDRA